MGAALFAVGLALEFTVPHLCIPYKGCPVYVYIMLLAGALVAYTGGFALVKVLLGLLELRMMRNVRVFQFILRLRLSITNFVGVALYLPISQLLLLRSWCPVRIGTSRRPAWLLS